MNSPSCQMLGRKRVLFLFLLSEVFLLANCFRESNDINIKRENHFPASLDDQRFREIVNLADRIEIEKLIDSILIPRVVGTDGHKTVREFIVETLRNLSWNIEYDTFEEATPNLGVLTFHNIIATINPNAERYLVLACHYDSKYFENEIFLGATDSAVPCAMLLNIANSLHKYMRSADELSLMLVFFDGEEAFLNWSKTDSIYGARHLAQKWESSGFLPRIDVLMLLDLLGAPDPSFYSFFKNTENWYLRLCSIESRLASLGELEHYTTSSASLSTKQHTYFKQKSTNMYIEDDHIPFLTRDVPILHIIPTPFPTVWHKMTDSKEIVELAVVHNLSKILYIFVTEYLEL